jgi:hypothetical protein
MLHNKITSFRIYFFRMDSQYKISLKEIFKKDVTLPFPPKSRLLQVNILVYFLTKKVF